MPGPRRYKYLLVLAVLWLGLMLNNFIWLRRDTNYFTYDSHRHFLTSLEIFGQLKHPSPGFLYRIVEATKLHPPFAMMVSAPFYFLFGQSQDTAAMANSGFFLAVLLFSIYKIGERTAGPGVGLLSAFIITLYPVIFNQLKVYMLDLPLTAMVTLNLYVLLLCNGSRNLKHFLLFGVSFGLGMLTKDAFIFYAIGPLIYAVMKNAEGKAADCRRHGRYFALSIISALLICSPYYLKKISVVFGKLYVDYVKTWPTQLPASGLLVSYIRAFIWYFWGFINWQASFLFFLLFLTGAYFFVKSKIRDKAVFWLWILVPWALVSFFRYAIGLNMEVTGVRYTMPVLPALALISAAGIMQIPARRARLIILSAAACLGVLQLFVISYPQAAKWFPVKIALPIRAAGAVEKYKLLPESIIIFRPGNWAVSGSSSGSYPKNAKDYMIASEEIIRTIGSSAGPHKGASVFIIPDDTRLWYLQYKARAEGRPISFFCDWNYLRRDIWEGKFSIPSLILSSDYIIDKDKGWLGEPYLQYWVAASKNYFALHKERFVLLREIGWPDHSVISIYKNISPAKKALQTTQVP